MKINDVNMVSYYVIQKKTADGTMFLTDYDFSKKNLVFSHIFHEAIPFTKLEVENFLNRLASNYFPETIEEGSQSNLAVIELKKSAKCLSIKKFSEPSSN